MQTYKVVISDLAKADLRNIVDYISEAESITTAKYVERGILSEMKKLEHFPTAHPKEEYASTNRKISYYGKSKQEKFSSPFSNCRSRGFVASGFFRICRR